MEEEPVRLRLKHLRERTRPRMSVQELADALGKRKSSYASYEDKFKKPFLPMDLVNALVPIFVERGIPEGEVLALGGAHSAPPARAGVVVGRNPEDLLGVIRTLIGFQEYAHAARIAETLSERLHEIAREQATDPFRANRATG